MNEPVERARRIQDKLLFIVAFSSRNCARRFPSAVGSSLGSFNLPFSRCAAEPAGKKKVAFSGNGAPEKVFGSAEMYFCSCPRDSMLSPSQ